MYLSSLLSVFPDVCFTSNVTLDAAFTPSFFTVISTSAMIQDILLTLHFSRVSPAVISTFSMDNSAFSPISIFPWPSFSAIVLIALAWEYSEFSCTSKKIQPPAMSPGSAFISMASVVTCWPARMLLSTFHFPSSLSPLFVEAFSVMYAGFALLARIATSPVLRNDTLPVSFCPATKSFFSNEMEASPIFCFPTP